jgi:ribonuclease HI
MTALELALLDPARRAEPTEPAAHPLSADAILLTYRMPGRPRSSLWIRHDGRWRLRFHQGTPTESRPAG